jgi:TrmH family RNA methyltransferase
MKRVVLVRPSGPRNVGAALRALCNFGPGELWLVAPQRRAILLHPDFEQMAHGALELAGRVRVVDSLAEALAECSHAVGFSARCHQHRRIRSFAERRAELAGLGADAAARLALVFGAENNGLAAEEADLCQELVHIQTSAEHDSINLAAAVAIVLHGLYEAATVGAPKERRTRGTPISGFARQFLIARVQKVFVGAAWTERAKRDIHGAVERVLRHAEIESRDARAWNQAMRALGDQSEPADLGLRAADFGLQADEARALAAETGEGEVAGREPDPDAGPEAGPG